VRDANVWEDTPAPAPAVEPLEGAQRAEVLAAIGCQGRGIAWQSAMGAELARLAIDPRYDPVLPITPIRPIPLHWMKAIGVAATIAAYRAIDRFGLS
jgi:hypothetical protein